MKIELDMLGPEADSHFQDAVRSHLFFASWHRERLPETVRVKIRRNDAGDRRHQCWLHACEGERRIALAVGRGATAFGALQQASDSLELEWVRTRLARHLHGANDAENEAEIDEPAREIAHRHPAGDERDDGDAATGPEESTTPRAA